MIPYKSNPAYDRMDGDIVYTGINFPLPLGKICGKEEE
jgi:hypothetical protein